MRIDNVLVQDGLSHQRITLADGIAALERLAAFGKPDTARVSVCPLKLPDENIVWLAALIFENHSSAIRTIVPLCTSTSYCCKDQEAILQQDQPVALLDNATVEYDGSLTLSDGRRVWAVRFVPAKLARNLTEAEYKIVSATLAQPDGSDMRYYRDLRDDVPLDMRTGIPHIISLDFARLRPHHGQPSIDTRSLKKIQAKYEKQFPRDRTPSLQTIAVALAKCGLRVRRIRKSSVNF